MPASMPANAPTLISCIAAKIRSCGGEIFYASMDVYGYPEVDFEAMNKAAAMLVGTHDFSCFQKVGSDNKTTVCTVFEAAWQPYTPAVAATTSSAPQYWFFRISADRFLRNMVRAIVGTLLDVGRGRRSLDEFAKLLEGGSRTQSGESAPGHALFLTGIEY